MIAPIIHLSDYRPNHQVPDGLSVNPMLGGKIALGFKPENGAAYRIVLTVEEAKRHVLECQDALDLVEGVLR